MPLLLGFVSNYFHYLLIVFRNSYSYLPVLQPLNTFHVVVCSSPFSVFLLYCDGRFVFKEILICNWIQFEIFFRILHYIFQLSVFESFHWFHLKPGSLVQLIFHLFFKLFMGFVYLLHHLLFAFINLEFQFFSLIRSKFYKSLLFKDRVFYTDLKLHFS